MAQAALHDKLLPQAPGGNAAGAGLALLVHAGLLVALTVSVDWRTHSPDIVSAELWAAVPQTAAPRAVEPAPAPVPAPAPPPPAPAPPPPQPAPQRDADIATERAERKKAEEERKKAEAQAEAERQRAEAEKKKREQAQKAEKAAQEAQAAEDRMAQQREENLRRMMGQAGTATGGSSTGGSGTAARDAAPSATYAGRVVAAVRRNIVFTGAVADEATTEIEVRAGASGTILSARMTKASGHKEWDDAVMRAVEKTGRLPTDVDGRVPGTLLLVFRPRE
jgi:colicin import membrane protein